MVRAQVRPTDPPPPSPTSTLPFPFPVLNPPPHLFIPNNTTWGRIICSLSANLGPLEAAVSCRVLRRPSEPHDSFETLSSGRFTLLLSLFLSSVEQISRLHQRSFSKCNPLSHPPPSVSSPPPQCPPLPLCAHDVVVIIRACTRNRLACFIAESCEALLTI